MPALRKPIQLEWTLHARAKMGQYRLTPSRVRHVLHSPKRVEEGIAPKTVAMMQPVSIKGAAPTKNETWNQEIWVMVQDVKETRRVISAWRYPGMTKSRSPAAWNFLRSEYEDFIHHT